MKTCEAFADLLDLYVDGELSPEQTAAVRAHLDTCPTCRAYVDDAFAIRASFPSSEEAEVPTGFANGVMAAIQAQSAPTAKKSSSRAKVLIPLAACIALVIALNPFSRFIEPAEQEAAEPRSGEAATYAEPIPEEAAEEPVPAENPADVKDQSPAAEKETSPQDSTPEEALPQPEPYVAQLLLTSEEAGQLLDVFTPLRSTDTQSDYEVPLKVYNVILSTLEEHGIVPAFHSSRDSLLDTADPDTALALITVLK